MSIEPSEADALAAIETVRTAAWGSDERSSAHALLAGLLEADLKQWIKEHPPTILSPTSYASDDPHRAVMLYGDNLRPLFNNNVIHDILYNLQTHFIRCAKNAIQASKSKGKKSTQDAIAARYPEYPALLKDIRSAKKAWNTEDTLIKDTHAFRMMGGLARLGSRSGGEYTRLVEKAQSMEKAVLGKILTPHTRAGR